MIWAAYELKPLDLRMTLNGLFLNLWRNRFSKMESSVIFIHPFDVLKPYTQNAQMQTSCQLLTFIY